MDNINNISDSESEISNFEEESSVESEENENINNENNDINNINNKKRKQINYTNVNFFSFLFFNWANHALSKSYKRRIKTKEISSVSLKQSTAYNIKLLEAQWNKRKNKKNSNNSINDTNNKYPLFFSILSIHRYKILLLFILDLSLMCVDYTGMFFFHQIIYNFSIGNFNHYSLNTSFKYYILTSLKTLNFDIYFSSVLFILLKIISTIIHNHLEFFNIMLSERITNESTALVYNKILLINKNNSNKAEGEIMNLIEVDCEKLGILFYIGPKIVAAPFRVIISIIFLFKLFGIKFIYCIMLLIFILLLIVILQILYLKNLKELLKKKDERSNIVTYIFHIIKSIKINGWEKIFFNKIKNKRDEELFYFNKSLNISLVRIFINNNMPLSILILSLGSYFYNNKTLEVSNLFTANNLIQNMTSPLMTIPLFLNEFFSNLISINRIQNFLYQQEHDKSNKYQNNEKLMKENILIRYKNISISSNNSYDNNNINTFNNNNDILLKDINFEIKKGEFIIILGSTGSGKTALINSILNNYSFNNEKNVIINGNISYTPQTSWIMNETIRNNIIFFNEFNKERYSKILTVCNLIYDLEKLPNGDLTKLLSNGSNISGGQRARINLARSLYKNADLYLLDDPLANIDSKVGNEIFNMAFLDFLKDKAKILITNELNGISSADKIIVLDGGKIKFKGNFKEFEKYLNVSKDEFRKENNIKTKEKNKIKEDNKIKNKKEIDKNDNKNEEKNLKLEKAKDIISISDKKLVDLTEKNNEILKKPKKEDISLHTYYTYIKLQGGYLIFIILICCIIGARYFDSYRRIYITTFTKTAKEINTNNINYNDNKFDINNKENLNSSQQKTFNFNTYLIISFLGILLNFFVEFIITQSTIYSLRTLHEKMILKLLRAPINLFHDIVSIGQILNRLTKDVEIVQLIINRVTVFFKSFALLASCIYICFIYNKYSLILSPVLLFFSLLLTIYYLSAARNMEHLHRTTFSPILTILNESIRGVELIRNFNNEENIKNKIYKRLDDHYGVHLYTEGCKRWYYQRLRYLTHIFNVIMIIIIIYKHEKFSTQEIGLILQYTEELSWELATFLGFFSQIEISLISLERCEKVTKIIEEKDCDKFRENNNNKDIKWPNKGEIEFKNYNLKYRPGLPLVLKNINIHIKPKEKIGLVGRTGSGKSSLVLAISRIVEAHKGTIKIDNIDIKDVNLDYLRHNICIIPQDTFLFEGTVKENIDPENKNNDKDIINILNEFGILKHLNDNNNKLNFYIKENGSNLSLGEKQLICFARVFLKNSKIIILDEATSSLDSTTENIIKKKLNNCEATLIIIAHHISMVKECEKIMVLDKGEIVEFDTYDNLLKNKKSKFFELYNESLIS